MCMQKRKACPIRDFFCFCLFVALKCFRSSKSFHLRKRQCNWTLNAAFIPLLKVKSYSKSLSPMWKSNCPRNLIMGWSRCFWQMWDETFCSSCSTVVFYLELSHDAISPSLVLIVESWTLTWTLASSLADVQGSFETSWISHQCTLGVFWWTVTPSFHKICE